MNRCLADAASVPLYGGGSGLFRSFSCNGNEARLHDCTTLITICRFGSSAGVVCRNGEKTVEMLEQ